MEVEDNDLLKIKGERYKGADTYFRSVSIQPSDVADRVQLERRSRLHVGDVRVYDDVCGPKRKIILH